ncbi:hypothetical protein [Pyrobaculum sp.]|uniref:hypothetical protein n=1 Tax=Pyrobaculum sp. TaxID=2004705 RepID=UPI0031616EA2
MVCEVSTIGDAVVFTAPELELAMAYLLVKPLAETVEVREGHLRATPAVPEIVHSLQELCKADVSAILLDIKESLLHMGWLVEGTKDVVKMRKSRRAGVAGFITVEYDKAARTMSITATQRCLTDFLKGLGFNVSDSRYFLEATRRVSSLVEALELEERISQALC